MSAFQIQADEPGASLLSKMCMPDDPEAWLIDWVFKNAPNNPNLAENSEITDKIITWLFEGRLDASNLSKLEGVTKKGCVAGDVLFFLMAMDHAGIAEPSLAKARWLVADFHKRAVHAGAHKVGYSDTQIKTYWRQFKRVAHLWAAFRMIQTRSGEKANEENFFAHLLHDPSEFLLAAKFFQTYAGSFRPARERNPEPLLASDAWRIVDSVPAAYLTPAPGFESFRLAPWMKQSLEQYRRA